MNKKDKIEWYENLPQEERMRLQQEFGNDGIPNRESKFYKWLKIIKPKNNG